MRIGNRLALLALLVAGCGDDTVVTNPDVAVPTADMSVGCSSNANCASSATGQVCYQGMCVVCGSDADCGGKKCDNHAACVECLAGTDCKPGNKCVNKACAQGCDANSPCATGQVCDVGGGVCVQCVADTDCAGGTPKCDSSAKTCVACLTDNDCSPGNLCTLKSCSAGCNAGHPCGDNKVCNTASSTCVECMADGDCKNPMLPRCDTGIATCVGCLPASDNCPTGMYCKVNVCDAGCKADADCMGKTTKCDTAKHVCVGCLDDAGCPLGQVCSSGTCIDGCNDKHGCPTGEGCCTGVCQKIQTDVKNCGACGKTCDAGKGCCAGVCADLSSTMNCGACGKTCDAGKGCCTGACTDISTVTNCLACGKACGAGENCCGTGCSDPKTDAKNCGACGKACDAGQDCCGSACVDLKKDAKNCGTCGKICTNGGFCVDGACVNPASCAEVLKAVPTAESGVFTIDPDGAGTVAPFPVYCEMKADGGGWTLAMKIDGKKATFHWDAAYWTNTQTFQADKTDFDQTEAKLLTFSTVSFTNMRLGMIDAGVTRWIVVPATSTSLYDALKGDYKATSVGRDKWKSLLASPSLQGNCNKEGFNAYGPSTTIHSRVRIGITSNQEGDCASNDSWIGFGGDQGGGCGVNTATSCGDVAYCTGDNGDRDTPTFGYVFVR